MKNLLGPALKYFLLFTVIYGVLTAISMTPAVSGFCSKIYRAPTLPILQSLLSKAYLQIKPDGAFNENLRFEFASKAHVQEQMQLAKQTGKAMANIEGRNNLVNFHNLFLAFFLFLTVLILLSPISWKEKILGMAVGTILYYFYTVFKLYLVELLFFNQPEIAIYQTGPTALKIASSIRFCMTMGTNVLVILFIWAVIVLKKDNWRSMLGEGLTGK